MDGMTPSQQLDAIAADADALVVAQQGEWLLLREMLAEQGIEVITAGRPAIRPRAEWLESHSASRSCPCLTPQAIDPSHPFPFITNLGLSLIFALETETGGEPVTELLMIPPTLRRFVRLPGEVERFIAIDSVISAHFSLLFPGFRKIARGVPAAARQRYRGRGGCRGPRPLLPHGDQAPPSRGGAIRLEFAADTPIELEEQVRTGLAATTAGQRERRLHRHRRPSATGRGRRPRPQIPRLQRALPERIAEHEAMLPPAICAKDIVVHHPYELRGGGRLPSPSGRGSDVVATATLYRAGKQSAIIDVMSPRPKRASRSPRWSN